MADKLRQYQGVLGRLHQLRADAREKWQQWKDRRSLPRPGEGNYPQEDYSHVFRRKTRAELVRISAAVMGIEFSYAAETAFVSPTLLKIGVTHRHMTMVWALSPLVGFFLTPVLGSLSDRCRLRAGRRRPFVLALAAGVLAGLVLVPNGELLGRALGDAPETSMHASTGNSTAAPRARGSNSWGVFLTILGTVLLDFDADACQSPSRAYLLDVTVPEDHARGLSTFTVMAGLGGFFGYALGGINWDATAIGELLGGHVRAVFTLIAFIFCACVATTVTSFKEIPLDRLDAESKQALERTRLSPGSENHSYGAVEASGIQLQPVQPKESYNSLGGKSDGNGYINYGFDERGNQSVDETTFIKPVPEPVHSQGGPEPAAEPTLAQYLSSIVFMPGFLRVLCLTNLFCWMAHVCYSLYFTDYVGEAVFQGDPAAADGTPAKDTYEDGVRFGCWGMSMYSLSCACYSLVIEKLIKRFRARRVYVGGLLFYSAGMTLMALVRHRVGVILFSWTAGVMYSTLFTMPYLLVARYHSTGMFETGPPGGGVARPRGLGTDVAIVSSMVFLAQFSLSMLMGQVVSAAGSTTAVVAAAALLSLCGALAATRVMYADL
ncbi:proton-associated sugar transporter A [Bacillus rossius redtenbacheri]|uniref:proton-associated sugar transporter A n=1 Tax=Bacillus rossius redtenbacheri TaxID=93214 RepID=UPI002FDE055C